MAMKSEWKPASTHCLLLQPLAFITSNALTVPCASPQRALHNYTIKGIV